MTATTRWVAGHASWVELRSAVAQGSRAVAEPASTGAVIGSAKPALFVTDVAASAAFYRDSLGFSLDFLHGLPPFYGSVTRGGATLTDFVIRDPDGNRVCFSAMRRSRG